MKKKRLACEIKSKKKRSIAKNVWNLRQLQLLSTVALKKVIPPVESHQLVYVLPPIVSFINPLLLQPLNIKMLQLK